MPDSFPSPRIQPAIAPFGDYVAITPTRDEADLLPRMISCMLKQTVQPETWILVDTGSTDGTRELIERLEKEHSWVRVAHVGASSKRDRWSPVVHALETGVRLIDRIPTIVVKVDADVSFGSQYFERVLRAFQRDPRLGMASGIQFERVGGSWRPQHTTTTMIASPIRAFRWECLEDVFPLHRGLGWDGADHVQASLHGWKTAVLPDRELAFRHRRREGARDGSLKYWYEEGRAAHVLRYRSSYLTARALYRAAAEPPALLLLIGYVAAKIAREPQLRDARATRRIREDQRLRHWLQRGREARGVVSLLHPGGRRFESG
jgi:biofilm PGA synthesis N-glycosyltransferase PgaC